MRTRRGARFALAARHFPRFSFDLIYARLGQTPEMWARELREALTLVGDHLSLYQLTIEPHTSFHTRARRGENLTAPDDASIAMFEATQEAMDAAGLPAYEISNHARAGHESRHNLTYWHYEDYVGIGPGAHGRVRDRGSGFGVQERKNLFLEPRTPIPDPLFALENHRAPDIWLDEVARNGHGVKVETALDADTAMREALMMGLRLTEGIDLEAWRGKFAAPLTDFLAVERLARLEKEGFIARDEKKLRATRAGCKGWMPYWGIWCRR